MQNNPNKGWRDGIIEQYESRIPPILKTDGKPCITVSSFWSHNQESGKSSPPVSHLQACSMGEVFSTQEKMELDTDPVTGHAAIFALFTLKQMSVTGGLLFFIVLALYFIFRKPRPSRKEARLLNEKNRIDQALYDDIGVEGAGVPKPMRAIMNINVDGQTKKAVENENIY